MPVLSPSGCVRYTPPVFGIVNVVALVAVFAVIALLGVLLVIGLYRIRR